MSNALAIAAVTKSLQELLLPPSRFPAPLDQDGLTWDVTTLPPDLAAENLQGNRLNVFLYHTTIDAAWRNQDPPTVRPGETVFPALPLVLHYIISVYGDHTADTAHDKDDILAHKVLGWAMSVLHDRPLLIHLDALSHSDLNQQVERVRITPQPLTVDEMYRLWMAFQTKYRISAAYEVSVVLIDSTQPVRTPPPVLTRGPQDTGPITQPDTLPPFPTLDAITLPNNAPVALAAHALTLSGHHLLGATAVRFSHPLGPSTTVPPTSVTDTTVTITVPPGLPAGIGTVAVVFGPDRATNELALAVAPQVSGGFPATVPAGGTVAVTCSQKILAGQRVSLLVGDQQVPLGSATTLPTTQLGFDLSQAELKPGTYLARLRVDGVDSPLVNYQSTPPHFDPTQKVTLT